MAQNALLYANPGSGLTTGSDDAAGVNIVRVKIGLGAIAAHDMDLDSGQQTMANSLPVAIASNQSALPVTDNAGSLTVDSAQLPAALAAGGGMKMEGVAGGVAVPVSGTFWQATQPVSDNGGSLTVDGTFWPAAQPVTDDGGSLTVDSGQLPAALAAGGGIKVEGVAGGVVVPVSGTVTANAGTGPFPVSDDGGSLTVDGTVSLAAGAANIGDIDVLSVPAPLSTTGGGTEAAALRVTVASDSTGVVNLGASTDHDVANTLRTVQVGGHASPVDVPPAVVSAAGDRVRAWYDRFGSQVMRRRKIRESYTAVFRLAEAAGRLDQTFTHSTNTNKQWATLHHIVSATKEVRLQRVLCYITAWSAAGQGVLEIRQISAAPATGNPAITPTPHRRGGTAAEAIALYLPTTAGTEAGANQPIASVPIDYGIMAAVPTTNPFNQVQPIVLYDAAQEDDEVMQPTLPVGVLDGWAVMLRTVGTPAVRMTIVAKFTEEVP